MAERVTTQTLSILHRPADDTLEIPRVTAHLRGPDGVEQKATLGLAGLLVGQSPDCSLVAVDPSISRRHAQLTLTSAGVVVRDLGSKNGVHIGAVRVREAFLEPGTMARLGDSQLWVEPAGDAARVQLAKAARFGEALGASPVMRALFALLADAAKSEAPVLLLGESGTGKELLARAVHEQSPRRDGPFVVLDCGALAPTLVESTLFGQVKGAFTGADEARTGLLAEANGGTLFIDEVGELPLESQKALLRVLETGEVTPLGGRRAAAADARVVAATHRDLPRQVAQGRFRQDLYFRIAVLQAEVPPLRARKDDIPLLVEHLLAKQNPPRRLEDLPPNLLQVLEGHDWPGNVRELSNTVSRWAIFPSLGEGALAAPVSASGPAPVPTFVAVEHLGLSEARDAVVQEFERFYLGHKLSEHAHNVSATARAMGISRQFLYRLMERCGLREVEDG